MRDATTSRAAEPATYVPPADRQALVNECLQRILAGAPLPPGLCPPAAPRPRCDTLEEGFARVLRGSGGTVG